MVRTSRSISRTAARLAAGGEPPDPAGGPAAPAGRLGRRRPRPLFVTADPDLLDDLLRLAADAGVTPDVAPDPAGARTWYRLAERVYVGEDMAEPCARAGLRRGSGVVVVMRERTPEPGTRAGRSAQDGGSSDSAGQHGGPAVRVRSGRGGRIRVGVGAGADGPPGADWEVVQRLGADHLVVLPAAEPWMVEQLAANRATGSGAIASTVPGRADATTVAHVMHGESVSAGTLRSKVTGGTSRVPSADVAAGTVETDDSFGASAGGRIVAVLGGRGGAGASVLAGALAVTAARRGRRTLLVDADPLGGGVDLVLGWESLDGLRWPALSQASGEVPAPALVEALPGHSELVILSWDRGEPMTVPPEAMLAALDAGRRGRDLTVVDLPRRLDESSMLALQAADQVYLVVPAELRACAAAARVAAVVAPHCAALSVVVRQPGPAGLAVKDVIAALRLPYAGTVRSEPRLRTAWERGEPPAATGRGSLATLCEKLLDDVVPSRQSNLGASGEASS